MKRIILAVGLCLVLTACGAQKAEVTPTPRDTSVPAPEHVLSETFRPNGYSGPVTVTVFYDTEGGQNRVEITQNGTVLQSITEDDGENRCAAESLIVEDVNFDGIPDIRFCYATFAGPNYLEHVYLYTYRYEPSTDASSFSYQKAEELDGYTCLSFDQESKTVLSTDYGTRMGGWTVLKWTGDGCALRRRALWERAFDGTKTTWQVWDRSPWAAAMPEEGEPDSAWVELARWESGETGEPEDALSPWLNLDYFGESTPLAPYEIPQDLLDLLTPLVEEETWWPFAQQYAAGREMDYDEAAKLWDKAGEDAVDAAYSDMVWGIRVDADNDGVEDAFLYNSQGTGKFHCFYLLRSGETPTEEGLLGNRTNAYFISWDGSRYLLVPSYSFATGSMMGLNVWLFREGKGVRRAYLERTVDAYEERDSWAAEGEEATLAALRSRAEEIWADFSLNGQRPVGAAERAGEWEWTYLSDWDNDGEEESYRKVVVDYPGLWLILEQDGVELSAEKHPWMWDSKGREIQLFWVDQGLRGNLICTAADGWGEEPIEFAVWFIEGETSCKLANLTLAPDYKANLSYYGPDCAFDW